MHRLDDRRIGYRGQDVVYSRKIRLASSHLITSCATFAAILLFVLLGSEVVPGAFDAGPLPNENGLQVAFILNIAIIIFGWRRSKDLKQALDAYERAELAAQEAAYVDFTTGLANRRHLMRALDDAISAGAAGTIIQLDLDDFKKVNDLYGHLAGDQLLKTVGAILSTSAPEESCCARTGGDEFAVLLPITEKKRVEQVAASILSALRKPIEIDHAAVRVSASIGIARLRKRISPVDALRQSDVAMYAAKRAGRNCFSWFDSALEREVRQRAQLEVDIKHGVEAGEFVPYFQPLIRLSTGDLIGFEVLARWHSPSRGVLEPKHFITLAEETGSIGLLSLSVMEQALTEAKSWPAHLKLSVNISPVQFRDPQLAHRIIQILTRTGFPPKRLELEITESSLLEDAQLVATTVASLKNLGITISLDDFGTGYASLSQLRTLPFDRIKIDQSFISTLGKDEQSAAIVSTITALGKSLNVAVTAEGVECEAIRGELSQLGCTEAQGYLFGRAVSADAVADLLSQAEIEGASASARPAPRAAGPLLPKAAGF